MHSMKALWLLAVASLLLISCSPISPQLQKQALQVPFDQLMEDSQSYQGEIVLLGGYIIKTRVFPQETQMVILQAPLGFEDRPKSRDKSKGRFIILHEGYLDPQVYQKDRAVTVAGTVVGKTTEKVDACPYACLTIKSRQIHLWPEEPAYPNYYYPPYDPFWGYPYYGRPFGYPYSPYYPFGPRYYPYW